MKKRLIPIIIFILITIILTAIVYAVFSRNNNANVDLTLGGFKVSGEIQGAGSPTENGIYQINRVNVDDIRLDLICEGEGWHYIRVKIDETWLDDSGNIYIVKPSTLTFGSGFEVYDNRAIDGYLYIKDMIDTPQTIEFIKKLELNPFNDSASITKLELIVKIEAVQFNRAKEHWGFETQFPWE